MKYRPEIDGLRAVAVLSVILFHAGFSAFSGGYAGVDVFFVISGYLITGIILREKDAGTFTIARFYERRARRILPALFFVLFACLPFAWLWLLPEAHEKFSRNLVASVLFLSNILAWRDSGYFSAQGAENPLLHIWSLAVEEQFYIFFPLFVMLCWRAGRRGLAGLIALGAAASYVMAEYMSYRHSVIGFYFPMFRAWELMGGALLAFLSRDGVSGKEAGSPRGRDHVAGVLGLLLVVVPVFVYDHNMRWPSAYTLAPVAGTAMLIHYARPGTWAFRILSLRALVGIGLVSYSAYLWHQPLFAFARLSVFPGPSPLLMGGLAVVALALAWLTWRFVETPFRRRTAGTGRRHLVLALAASFLLVAIGIGGMYAHGFPGRFAPAALVLADVAKERDGSRDKCHFSESFPPPPRAACWLNGHADRAVAFLGDSLADAIAPGLAQALRPYGLDLQQQTYSGCAPVRAIRRDFMPAVDSYRCPAFNDAVFNWVVNDPAIRVVVLHAAWESYARDDLFRSKPRRILDFILSGGAVSGPGYFYDAYAAYVRLLLDAGKKVVIVYPAPRASYRVPDAVARRAGRESPAAPLTMDIETVEAFDAATRAAFDALHDPGLYRFYTADYLCDREAGTCTLADGEGVYYRDHHHLSHAGTARVAGPLAAMVAQAAARAGVGSR